MEVVSNANMDCGKEERTLKDSDRSRSNVENCLVLEICDLPEKIKSESKEFSEEVNAMKEDAKVAYQQFDKILRKFQSLENKVSTIKTLMGAVPVQEVQELREDMNQTVKMAESDMLDIRSTINSFPSSVATMKAHIYNVLYHLDMYELPNRKPMSKKIYHIYSPIKSDECPDQDTSYEDIEYSTSLGDCDQE